MVLNSSLNVFHVLPVTHLGQKIVFQMRSKISIFIFFPLSPLFYVKIVQENKTGISLVSYSCESSNLYKTVKNTDLKIGQILARVVVTSVIGVGCKKFSLGGGRL